MIVEEDERVAEQLVAHLSAEVSPRQLLRLKPLRAPAEDLSEDQRLLARRLAESVSVAGSRRAEVYAREIERLGTVGEC